MDTPVLYIIAGPNGIGKTTSAFDIIPQNIPIIRMVCIDRMYFDQKGFIQPVKITNEAMGQ